MTTRRLIVLCGRAYCNGNCGTCRHGRFNPGPPTSPRGVNFYGHFRQGVLAKRFGLAQRIAAAHEAAVIENRRRDEIAAIEIGG